MTLGHLRALFITDPLIIVMTIFMGSLSLLASFFDGTGHAQHRLAGIWSRRPLRVRGVEVEAEGGEELDPHWNPALGADHRSFLETPAANGHIPPQVQILAQDRLVHHS